MVTLKRTVVIKQLRKLESRRMSYNKHKPYPSEFKESVDKLAIESKQPIAQIARELGIKVHTLYSWITKYSKLKDAAIRTDEHIYDENKL